MRNKIQKLRSMFDSEATDPLKLEDIVREAEDPLTEVANMSTQEVREYLPLAQKDLEAIESDLEQLMEQKDTTIILIAAMHAKLDALTEAGRQEEDLLGLSRVRER